MSEDPSAEEHFDLALHTRRDLERARNRGQMIGWVQGAGVVIVGGMVLNLLGWIPTLLVVGGVAYVLYKLLGGSGDDE